MSIAVFGAIDWPAGSADAPILTHRAIVTENLLASLADPLASDGDSLSVDGLAVLRAAAPEVAHDGLYSVADQLALARRMQPCGACHAWHRSDAGHLA